MKMSRKSPIEGRQVSKAAAAGNFLNGVIRSQKPVAHKLQPFPRLQLFKAHADRFF